MTHRFFLWSEQTISLIKTSIHFSPHTPPLVRAQHMLHYQCSNCDTWLLCCLTLKGGLDSFIQSETLVDFLLVPLVWQCFTFNINQSSFPNVSLSLLLRKGYIHRIHSAKQYTVPCVVFKEAKLETPLFGFWRERGQLFKWVRTDISFQFCGFKYFHNGTGWDLCEKNP